MKKQPGKEEMLVRMAGLCAGAEHCAADIRDKILKKGFTREEADRMVDYLERNRYIDDFRFARAFAADKCRFSGWGRVKIRVHLKAKRISDEAIGEGLRYISEADYVGVLRKVLHAKASRLDLADVADRQRLYRHLASRGFEASLIIPEIRKYMADARQTSQDEE